MGKQHTDTYESFKNELEHYNRSAVARCIKNGILEECPDGELKDIYVSLFALKDMNIVNLLSKQKYIFRTEYLQMDLANWNNCRFIQDVLKKYSKKFDLQDPDTCKALFQLACDVHDEKLVQNYMKNLDVVEMYPILGSSVDHVFVLLQTMEKKILNENLTVELYYQAAIMPDGADRLYALNDWGYDLSVKNSDGKTVQDLLKERITTYRYPKNRTGEILRKKDQATIRSVNRILNPPKEEPEKDRFTGKKNRKKMIVAVLLILFVGIGIGICISGGSGSDSESSESESEYATDTSLTVEDGDTVNIDYTGYIDGEAFDGGSTDGAGADLTIGSGTYIDDFEEQLIGSHPGDSVTVEVTFPEDYGNEELNGKDAEFDVTVNGIYE